MNISWDFTRVCAIFFLRYFKNCDSLSFQEVIRISRSVFIVKRSYWGGGQDYDRSNISLLKKGFSLIRAGCIALLGVVALYFLPHIGGDTLSILNQISGKIKVIVNRR